MNQPETAVNTPNATATSATKSTWPRRWWLIPSLLVIAAIIEQITCSILFAENGMFAAIAMFVIWPGLVLALGIWWVGFSGFSLRTRGLGCVAAIGITAILLSIFRLEESDGNMLPTRWSFRWTPDRASIARDYFAKANRQTQKTTAGAATTTDTSDVTNTETPNAVAPLVAVGPHDWPRFRGPRGNSTVPGITISADWSTQPPAEVWRHPVGQGWSSFAVAENLVFTQEQRDEQECVVCYDLKTGEQIWLHTDQTIFSATPPMGGPGPRATPTLAEGLLYTQGATGLLNCLNPRTGQRVWQRNILTDAGASPDQPAANLEWGMAGSPLVSERRVYCSPGGTAGRSVIAYDALTGDVVWTAGNHVASYNAISLETLHGVPQLLAFHGDGLASYSLAGQELWFIPWTNQPKVNISQPVVVGPGSLIFGCGYGVGSARAELTVEQDKWSTQLAWQTIKLKPKFNDLIAKDNFIYGLDDGILTCIDATSGQPKWKKGRYSFGQLLLLDDQILVLTEAGEVVIVAADPQTFREVTRFQALGEGITWNHPVFAQGHLLVRNAREAACYKIAPGDIPDSLARAE